MSNIKPWTAKMLASAPSNVGVDPHVFLLECEAQCDGELRKYSTTLFVPPGLSQEEARVYANRVASLLNEVKGAVMGTMEPIAVDAELRGAFGAETTTNPRRYVNIPPPPVDDYGEASTDLAIEMHMRIQRLAEQVGTRLSTSESIARAADAYRSQTRARRG